MKAAQTTGECIRSDKNILNLAISDVYEDVENIPVMLKTKMVALTTNDRWRAMV